MARPFLFTLEKVLDYRRQREDQAKLALRQARQDAERQEELCRHLDEELKKCLDEMGRIKTMTEADLWLWSSWRKCLELDKKLAQTRLAELRNLVETRRLELVIRAKDRKLLEKLRTNQATKHRLEEQRNEQKEYDETATLRYGRTVL